MFLSVYGRRVRNYRKWGKIINTGFSAKITTFATRNSKNDVIWSLSRESAGDMFDAPEEKFTKGHMIWVGVSYRGLVPGLLQSLQVISTMSMNPIQKPSTV